MFYAVCEMGVENAFGVVAGADYDAGGGGAGGVAGSVYGVDVIDEEVVVRECGEQDAAFGVPGSREGGCAGCEDVSSEKGADAVDFSVESGGVVFVAGKGEVRVVETMRFVG